MRSFERNFLRLLLCVASVFLLTFRVAAQVQTSRTRPDVQLGPRDPSKPVPAKSDIINAWQKRQEAVKSFRFEEKLADGSKRLVSEAKVSSYKINLAIETREFR